MKRVYESIFWYVDYNPELLILETGWTKMTNNMSDEIFKDHLMRLAELIEEYKVKAYTANCLELFFALSLEIQEWHDTVMIPLFIKGGIQKIAFIRPDDFISDLSIEQTFDENNAKAIQVCYFDNEKDAKDWIA